DADDLDAGGGEHRVERRRELAVAVAQQEPEPIDALVEVHQQKTDQQARGSSRDNAANTTRSAGCSLARRTCRRSTATSCRNTSSSTSLAPPSRASCVNTDMI